MPIQKQIAYYCKWSVTDSLGNFSSHINHGSLLILTFYDVPPQIQMFVIWWKGNSLFLCIFLPFCCAYCGVKWLISHQFALLIDWTRLGNKGFFSFWDQECYHSSEGRYVQGHNERGPRPLWYDTEYRILSSSRTWPISTTNKNHTKLCVPHSPKSTIYITKLCILDIHDQS
jgi:hypothetical protein